MKSFIKIFAVIGLLFLGTSQINASGIEAGKWIKEWKKTKKEFEKITGKKKPSKKILRYFRKSSGIEKAIKKLDSAYKKLDKNRGELRDNIDKFSTAINDYRTVRIAYVKMLKNDMEKENLLMKKDKRGKQYIAWLKILKKDLKAIERSAEKELQWYNDILSNKGDYLKTIFASIKARIKEAKVYIAKIKATPTPKNWNNNPNSWLRNFLIIAGPDKFEGADVDTETLEALNDRLSDFLHNNELKKNYGKLPLDTPKNVILKKISVLDSIITGYSNWYKANEHVIK